MSDITISVQETGTPISLVLSGGSASFLGLVDTPNSYAGKAGFFLTVSGNESGLSFEPVSAISLTGLKDVVAANPQSGDILIYNGTSWINQENISATIGGVISVPSGVTYYEEDSLSLDYTPKFFNVNLMAPSGQYLIYAAQRANSANSNGFIVDFAATIPNTGYVLGWEPVK
jgi:hypothetical protein